MREPPTNICPLMCIAGSSGTCIEERCAWWDSLYYRCAVLTIAASLEEVTADE